LLADSLTMLVGYHMFVDLMNNQALSSLQGSVLVLLGKMFLFMGIVIVRKIVGNDMQEGMEDVEWLRFLIFPIFTICIIVGMLSILERGINKKQQELLFVIAAGMVGMNIVVFYMIHDILEKGAQIRENQVLQVQMENQTKMYYSISENFERQRKKTHEYKNQILCMESLLSGKKYEALGKYIQNIGQGLAQENDAINTNHVIVNAILNSKYQEMKKKNIIFVFRINDLSSLQISEEDIVVILSNMLNNAIEANEKCPPQMRQIKLKFMMEETGVILSVKNTFDGVLLQQDGGYRTRKEDAREHGIGIANIRTIVERYKGECVIEHENNEFLMSVWIPRLNC
jgi:two-component system sensor histidine kinase AgrC